MSCVDQGTVTQLLLNLRQGVPGAMDSLFSRVYENLRDVARRQRRGWDGHQTLNTTALVHEVCLRLVDQREDDWEGRAHFMGVAARAMRRLLVDHARRKKARKRGGDVQKVPFEEGAEVVIPLSEKQTRTLELLDDALKRLERNNTRQGQVVECRFFGNMSIEATAAALGISRNTVKRDWSRARVWLLQELQAVLSPEADGYL